METNDAEQTENTLKAEGDSVERVVSSKNLMWDAFVAEQVARVESHLVGTGQTIPFVKINAHKAIRAMHAEKMVKQGECEAARNAGDVRAALLHEGRAEGLERAISLILRGDFNLS